MDGEWQTIDLPFREFAPVFRAKSLRDGAPLDPSAVSSIQLMHSKFEVGGRLGGGGWWWLGGGSWTHGGSPPEGELSS